jgi:hypothetical protein
MFGTTNPDKKIYDNITFMDTLTDPVLSSVKESDIEKLSLLISQCDLKTDDGLFDAQRYAKKMAIFHGVPGLIHYVNLQVTMMVVRFSEGEDISAQCLNTLAYLKLAKMIYDTEGKLDTRLQKILPNDDITNPEYWAAKEHTLSRFGDIKLYQDEAVQMAQGMFRSDNRSSKKF